MYVINPIMLYRSLYFLLGLNENYVTQSSVPLAGKI